MRKVALFLLGVYNRLPLAGPGHCIHMPTCSEYAREAFLKYHFFKALRLSLFRIIRCNPLVKGGFDPVK